MNLADLISKRSGQPVDRCYGCQKCTAGCAAAPEMDLAPHEVAQRVLLGEDEAVLGSSAIWLCVGCETCGQRCPNGISLGEIMSALRALALARGFARGSNRVAAFHAASAANVRERGRLHEASMLLDYGRRAFLGREALTSLRDLVAPAQPPESMREDVRVGWRLLRQGKLPLRAVKGVPDGGLRGLFEQCATLENASKAES